MMVVHLRVTGDRLSRDLKTREGSAGTMKITTHKQHVERSWQGKDHLTREAWLNRGYSGQSSAISKAAPFEGCGYNTVGWVSTRVSLRFG